MEMDINTELTGLRNEASFLRKENFDLKEKIQVWVQTNRQRHQSIMHNPCRTVPIDCLGSTRFFILADNTIDLRDRTRGIRQS